MIREFAQETLSERVLPLKKSAIIVKYIMISRKIIKSLVEMSDPAKACSYARFFQTHKGGYGEGDRFYGITVPAQKAVAKKYYKETGIEDLAVLLKDPYHEVRLTALMIAVEKFKKADEKEKKALFGLYLKNTRFINNWDLVDCSAPKIVGAWLFDKDRAVLYKLALSKDLWERRIAVIASFYFIRMGEPQDALKICEILLGDEHDLIHKACGWMLREIGGRDMKAERDFLDKHKKVMPRTMLRYAIEKFPEELRLSYLRK